jgi:hypothetical protein
VHGEQGLANRCALLYRSARIGRPLERHDLTNQRAQATGYRFFQRRRTNSRISAGVGRPVLTSATRRDLASASVTSANAPLAMPNPANRPPRRNSSNGDRPIAPPTPSNTTSRASTSARTRADQDGSGIVDDDVGAHVAGNRQLVTATDRAHDARASSARKLHQQAAEQSASRHSRGGRRTGAPFAIREFGPPSALVPSDVAEQTLDVG